MTTINEIHEGIRVWKQILDNAKKDNEINEIIKYLNQGFCFEVNKDDFLFWKGKNPPSIHAYIAIFKGELKFVLIDSKSDETVQVNTDNIIVKDFTYGIPSGKFPIMPCQISGPITKLPVLKALSRKLMWDMYCQDWLTAILKTEKKEIVQAFSIPYGDYKSAIEDSNMLTVASFLGLECVDGAHRIEIIVAKVTAPDRMPEDFYDVSRPVPPFGGGVFKLLS